MAARRLLIVMLVLLGLSTLAAALVPQRSLRNGTTTSTTTTQPTTTEGAAPAVFKPTEITVGGRKFPIVYPVRVGDRLTLLVRSTVPTQIEIPEFGQLGFAAPVAPARFELLAREPGTFGILFAQTGKVAAQIRVVPAGKKIRKKPEKEANPPARGESGPA